MLEDKKAAYNNMAQKFSEFFHLSIAIRDGIQILVTVVCSWPVLC